jgi:hypothetical protein
MNGRIPPILDATLFHFISIGRNKRGWGRIMALTFPRKSFKKLSALHKLAR